jgi:hypothetical protein
MNTSFEDCAPEDIGMSRKIGNTKYTNLLFALAVSLAAAGISGPALAATSTDGSQADGGNRLSISLHHVEGGRDHPSTVTETTEDYAPLLTTGGRAGAGTRGGAAKPGAVGAESQSGSFDFWIYEADVILFNDDDGDGYYHGIDLLIDADTIYSSADVYAVLYLSLEGGPWNEYGVTEDFTIFGSSANDEYVMVTELMQGYPTGSYDLLIELFDVYDGTFVASYGPADTSELAYLPLEDFNRDDPVAEPQVVVNHGSGGGGAMDAWLISLLLLILLGGAIRKIWRRRNDMLMRIDSPPPIWQSIDHTH